MRLPNGLSPRCSDRRSGRSPTNDGSYADTASRLLAELKAFPVLGGAHGTATERLPTDTLDEASRRRPRSLGYTD